MSRTAAPTSALSPSAAAWAASTSSSTTPATPIGRDRRARRGRDVTMFETNVFGLVDITNRIVPLMKAQGHRQSRLHVRRKAGDGRPWREQAGGARSVSAGRRSWPHGIRRVRLSVEVQTNLAAGRPEQPEQAVRTTSRRRSWRRSTCRAGCCGRSWRFATRRKTEGRRSLTFGHLPAVVESFPQTIIMRALLVEDNQRSAPAGQGVARTGMRHRLRPTGYRALQSGNHRLTRLFSMSRCPGATASVCAGRCAGSGAPTDRC